jgi:Spy/CpxP family protein refolding chaperone
MNKTALFAAALAVMVCSTTAFSQGPSGSGGRGGGMMSCPAMVLMPPSAKAIESSADTLGLTDEEVTSLKATISKADETLTSLTQKATNATKALRDALMASSYDEQKVIDLAVAAEKAEAAVISARIDEWTQLRAVLTADQITKLQASGMQRPNQGSRPSGPPPGGEGGFQPMGSDGPPPPDMGE